VSTMTEDARAWHALREVNGLGPKGLGTLARALTSQHMGANELVGADADRLRALGLKERIAAEAARALADPAAPPASPEHATVVTPDHEKYPVERLASPLGAPVVLYCAGNLDLLRARGVAVAGSRDAHEQALAFAAGLVEALDGLNVVAGAAAGIDETAHRAALSAGRTTTAVLAEGIDQPRARDGLRMGDPERLLIVSEFDPGKRWTRYQAMARNRTIAWLAGAVVVVAAGDRGGSWEQAQLCLKENVPLFVPDFPAEIAPANRRLIEAGARALDPNDARAAAELVAGVEPEPRQLELLT